MYEDKLLLSYRFCPNKDGIHNIRSSSFNLTCFSPAILRGHPPNVHEGGIPKLLPHRALGERVQPAPHQAAAALQLDQGRHHIPERAEICTGG